MSTTTIRQLIDALEEIAANCGDDTQVLAAHQPSYPLAEMLSCVVETRVTADGRLVDDDEDADYCEGDECEQRAVVVTEDGAFCVVHAEEEGIDLQAELANSTPVAWLVLNGHPSEYSDSAWKSPYASSGLWEEIGTSYTMS